MSVKQALSRKLDVSI